MSNGDDYEDTVQKVRDYVRGYAIRNSSLTYFVTQTLKPTYYKMKIDTQHTQTYCKLGHAFKEWCTDFIYLPEITKQGNIHYHAIVTFKNEISMLRFIEQTKSKQWLGFMKITSNSIEDKVNMIRSKEYLIKDVETTIKFVKCANLIHRFSDFVIN